MALSVRSKVTLTLIVLTICSTLLVGGVAKWLILKKFDAHAEQRAFDNFSEDVGRYIQRYGSWQLAAAHEDFGAFVARERSPARMAPGGGPVPPSAQGAGWQMRPPPGSGPPPLPADALRPEPADVLAPAGRPGQQPLQAPFGFVLLDPNGQILHGARLLDGDYLDPKLLAQKRAIAIDGQVVAYAVPYGKPLLSAQDRFYLTAVDRALVYAVTASVCLALLTGLLFGNRLSRPIRLLAQAIVSMKAGDLRRHVSVRSGDEVGVLATSFNRMSHELADLYEELEQSHATMSEQAQQLRELSVRDGLTGLYNRRHFSEQAHQLFNQSIRYDKPLTVLLADIDHFKAINDTWGHSTGDRVLRRVAQALASGLRESDLLARYGGEEFVVMFPETGPEEAWRLAERLRQIIEQIDWQDLSDSMAVTLSLGLDSDIGRVSVDAMLDAADRNLYRAKESGRNRVVA